MTRWNLGVLSPPFSIGDIASLIKGPSNHRARTIAARGVDTAQRVAVSVRDKVSAGSSDQMVSCLSAVGRRMTITDHSTVRIRVDGSRRRFNGEESSQRGAFVHYDLFHTAQKDRVTEREYISRQYTIINYLVMACFADINVSQGMWQRMQGAVGFLISI